MLKTMLRLWKETLKYSFYRVEKVENCVDNLLSSANTKKVLWKTCPQYNSPKGLICMKKFLAITCLLLTSAFSLASCGSTADREDDYFDRYSDGTDDTIHHSSDSAGDHVKDAVDGAKNAGEDIIDGAQDAGKDIIDGVGDAGKDIIGGAGDAAKDITDGLDGQR